MPGEGFVKIYEDIVNSTVWANPIEIRMAWVIMLIQADAAGIVRTPIPTLATMAGISPEQMEAALELFQRPDKYSRTKTDEGRRIRPVKVGDDEEGWLVINHKKYRKKQTKKQIRDAEYQAEKREATKDDSETTSSDIAPEAEAEAEAEAEKKDPPPPPQRALPGVVVVKDEYIASSPERAVFEDCWNQMCDLHHSNFLKLRTWTKKRKGAFNTRMADPWWRDHWIEGLNAIPYDNDFLNGQVKSANGKYFSPNPDWFLTEQAVPKILEGFWNNPAEVHQQGEGNRSVDEILAETEPPPEGR